MNRGGRSGWKLLWNDGGRHRPESVAQIVFLGIVKHYCSANDIDIAKEANIGRGPVDFKVSRGMQLRSLLEVKLADNSKFWNGLTKQLPTYQKAEEVKHGYFIVVAFSDKDFERVNDIEAVVAELRASLQYNIATVVVDATPDKPSASKL